MPDYDRLRYEELASISELLHGLSNEQWHHDSLCRGWRVRDVVSHIVVGYTTPVALHDEHDCQVRLQRPEGLSSRVRRLRLGAHPGADYGRIRHDSQRAR